MKPSYRSLRQRPSPVALGRATRLPGRSMLARTVIKNSGVSGQSPPDRQYSIDKEHS